MTFRPREKWACLAALALSLASCSRSADQYLASGDKSFAAGKYSEAVIEYRNAIQVDPRRARAHYQLGRTYLELKSPEAAYKELQETVTLDPTNREAQLQLAALLISGKRYDDAKALVEKVLAADSGNVRAHGLMGDLFALRGDRATAIREYQTAIRLDPQRVEMYTALAGVYASGSELADAETALRQGVQANPQTARARVNLGRFYFSQRKFAQAEEEERAASGLDPSDPLPRLMLANSYIAEGNLAEAEKVCAQLKAIGPDTPEAYRALALFYGSTGQRVKAVAELKSLRSSKPKDLWVKAYLAETLLDLNRVDEANGPTQEVLAADPNDPRGLILEGRILISRRKYSEALSALENAVKGAPESATAAYFLGVAQQASGLSSSAKASFAESHRLSPAMMGPAAALAELDANSGAYEEAERLAKANPNDPLAQVVGAEAELAKGNTRGAEQAVQSALERDPVSEPALRLLVKLCAQEGKLREAAQRLMNLAAQHPQNARIQFLLSLAYFNAKDLDKAEAGAKRAISLDRQTPDAHALLAEIEMDKGMTREAVTEYRAAIDSDPRRDTNYLALANLYESAGNWQDARKTLEKAHQEAPDSAYVSNNLAFLYAEHGTAPGDGSMALSLAQEAKRALPDSPVISDTLGWAYYKLGQYEAAIEQFTLSAEKLPENPAYQYHLGMAYLGAGRFEEAKRALQRALGTQSHFAEAESARAALATIARESR